MNRTLIVVGAAVVAACAAITISVLPASGEVGGSAPAHAASANSGGSALGSTHFLTLAAARKAADVAMANCAGRGFPVAVTVLDRDGVVIVQERADTATGATVNVSEQKAYAAVGFQSPTSALQDAAQTQPGFTAIDGFNILPGGLPITLGGSVVAGIGVSGSPSGDTDALCGTAGIKAIS
jgi:uncharacterized protein GlcG (DUF336 family)